MSVLFDIEKPEIVKVAVLACNTVTTAVPVKTPSTVKLVRVTLDIGCGISNAAAAAFVNVLFFNEKSRILTVVARAILRAGVVVNVLFDKVMLERLMVVLLIAKADELVNTAFSKVISEILTSVPFTMLTAGRFFVIIVANEMLERVIVEHLKRRKDTPEE